MALKSRKTLKIYIIKAFYFGFIFFFQLNYHQNVLKFVVKYFFFEKVQLEWILCQDTVSQNQSYINALLIFSGVTAIALE